MLSTFRENCFPIAIDICFWKKITKLFRSIIDWWKLDHSIVATTEFQVGFRGFWCSFINPMNCSTSTTSKVKKRRNNWTYTMLKDPRKEWATSALGSSGCRAMNCRGRIPFLLHWRGGICWGACGTRLRRGDSEGLRSRISARRHVWGVTWGVLTGETEGLGVVGRWGHWCSRCLSSSCGCAWTNLFKERTLKAQ